MFMKVAVVNNSGNVGKSTICNSLLKTRLEDSAVIKIESINSDGFDDEKFNASDFVEIFNKIATSPCAIIDVGSSNIEVFTKKLRSYKGSQEDFDYFIIPVTPQNKQQVDTLSTIETLLDLNVEPEKIRLIFNMVEPDKNFDKQFSIVLDSHIFKELNIKSLPIIHESELFTYLYDMNKTLESILADDRDFRVLMRETNSKEELEKLSTERAIKRLANGVNEELDTAFSALNLI